MDRAGEGRGRADGVEAERVKAAQAAAVSEVQPVPVYVRNADIGSRTNAGYPACKSGARSAGLRW